MLISLEKLAAAAGRTDRRGQCLAPVKKLAAFYVSPVPFIIHRVVAILHAVATPLAASVRDPVVPAPARTSVSEVIAIVTVPADVSLKNEMHVPMV